MTVPDNTVVDQGLEDQDTVADTTYADTFLKDVPETERPIVEKYVKQWDAGVTKRFQDVHSEYADYKPFKEAGIDADYLSQSLALAQALEADPAGTVKAVAEAYGISFGEAAAALEQGVTQPPATQQPAATPDFYQDPRFTQLEQLATTAANILVQQQESQEAANADRELEQTLVSLKEKYGDYDERYVVALAMQNGSLEDSVKEYKAWEQQVLTAQNRPAPTVLGSGGGLPATDIDPSKLNSKDTRALVTQLLTKAQQER